MITVVDCGMGNIGSILNMCRHLGIEANVATDSESVGKATKLILPGVGAFDTGMLNLDKHGLQTALQQKVMVERTPILGICLGMQLFARHSEEGRLPGLGWLQADVMRFHSPPELRPPLQIPHMGWSYITPQTQSRLFQDMPGEPRFYFVHSYHVVCDAADHIAATTHHGGIVTAAIERGHLFGTQFHPEKSHRYGMQLLRNFARL